LSYSPGALLKVGMCGVMMSRETFDWEKNMQPFADKWYKIFTPNIVIDRSVHCKLYDLKLDDVTVEEKFLFSGKEYDNVLIELIQDANDGSLGWFYHMKADVLAWYYCPADHVSQPISCYWIDTNLLKDKVLFLLKSKPNHYLNMQICNLHYGITFNMPILWSELLNDGIAKHFIF